MRFIFIYFTCWKLLFDATQTDSQLITWLNVTQQMNHGYLYCMSCHQSNTHLAAFPELDHLTMWKALEETRSANSKTESECAWHRHSLLHTVWPTSAFSLAAAYHQLRNTPLKRTRAPTNQQILLSEAPANFKSQNGCCPASGRLGVTSTKETQTVNWADLWVTLTRRTDLKLLINLNGTGLKEEM